MKTHYWDILKEKASTNAGLFPGSNTPYDKPIGCIHFREILTITREVKKFKRGIDYA